jgi:hypothetical protein
MVLKLVIIRSAGFEIQSFKHTENARHTFRTIAGQERKEHRDVVALFLYDRDDTLMMATNVREL